ncbi:MaoC family dehydratase [Parvularcula sp. ZS-1/3]|uniref:MaoC family dehydratase n=1 Tax=Parvularcula mediterranea TaxID=2732508 RepID=A0A7Y3RKM9_9PROT|nr:MaoC family dehydratase [Parvularcula mediterranea]NNU15296.1 MaoC family dehydratase [Parvularcula mediterranea]
MPGLWFSEFEEGQVFDHEWTRTMTEADNHMFSLMTMNPQPLHIDHHKAAATEFGKPLVNSLFSLGCLVGMTVNDTTLNTTVANLGMEKVRFPAPLFHGDTVRCRTTVVGVRPSKSRPGQGIVTFLHEMFNQDDTLVASCERAALMKAKPE